MEQKCQPPVEKWRLVFERHTKMGSGGCDITQVEVGVRCLTKEFAAALQQIINEYIKALRNYHAGQQVPADVLLSPKPAKIMKREKLQLQIPVCLNCLPICPDQPGMCGSL
ncbi:unnamed protein product [Sphagnum troendelagicum]